MRKFHKDESGLAVVEATILLPFCMIMVIAIYYAAIFMCQKANLQANLQNALIYYKNVESDTYVTAGSQMGYGNSSGTVTASGSSYSTPQELFPYRFFGMKFNKTEFESFFRSMCGYMFFDTGSNVSLTADKKNFIVYVKLCCLYFSKFSLDILIMKFIICKTKGKKEFISFSIYIFLIHITWNNKFCIIISVRIKN